MANTSTPIAPKHKAIIAGLSVALVAQTAVAVIGVSLLGLASSPTAGGAATATAVSVYACENATTHVVRPSTISASPISCANPSDHLVSWPGTDFGVQTPPPTTTTAPASTTTTSKPTTTTASGPPSAFPTPQSTGVPSGTVLTAYTGPMTISSCGVTIDSKTITGDLTITAGNGTHSASTPCVTITRSKIKGTVYDGYTSQYNAGPLVMSDVEVANPTPADCATISDTNYYLTRVYVHGCRSGAQADGYWNIQDSYLLADVEFGTAHMDGFISNGNYGQPFVLNHNTFLCKPTNSVPNGSGCAADLGLFGDFSAISFGKITNNQFLATNDAYYCVHTGYEPAKPYPNGGNLVYSGNVWQLGASGSCGGPGSAVYDWSSVAGKWCNNRWSDGSLISAAFETGGC